LKSSRRSVNLRRAERARNEGTTGPNRLNDARCKTYKRRINYRVEADPRYPASRWPLRRGRHRSSSAPPRRNAPLNTSPPRNRCVATTSHRSSPARPRVTASTGALNNLFDGVKFMLRRHALNKASLFRHPSASDCVNRCVCLRILVYLVICDCPLSTFCSRGPTNPESIMLRRHMLNTASLFRGGTGPRAACQGELLYTSDTGGGS